MTPTAPTPPDQAQRATLTTHHCIAVACTGCGQHYDDEFTHHFASVAHALRVITNEDWVVTEDTVLCWQCGSHDARRAPTPAALTRCEYCYPPLFSDTPPPEQCQCRRDAVTHVMVPFVSGLHPGFQPNTCVSIQCSDCDDDLGYEECTPHYPTPADAFAAATQAGWLVAESLLVTCPGCTHRRTCVMLGHQWPEHPSFVSSEHVEYRWCQRECGEYVLNPVDAKDMPWL
jgi:hypothetical protein